MVYQQTAPEQNKRLMFFVPVIVFMTLAIYFAIGLTKDPSRLPSVLIDTPVEDFQLLPIKGRANPDREWGLETVDFKGEVSLVNIFGSWCISCQIEHPFLMQVKENTDVPIHGIDWREKNPDDGPNWLARKGDPYTLIGDDPDSKGSIAFGVTGAPETFVIDKNGVIRYKLIGPMDLKIWNETIFPIIEELRKQ